MPSFFPFRRCGARVVRRVAAALVVLGMPPATALAHHVDLVDFPSGEANWDRFYALEAALMRGFDAYCADTLCEGEYSNLQVMQFRCAVDSGRGTVRRCAWVVVASEVHVDPVTGHLQPDTPRWVCPVELGPGVRVERFHAALAQPDGMLEPLPGSGVGLFTGLAACLQGQGNVRRAG
ncbi:hypothetical protein [Stenotrophomonas sp. 24(2023)]|uniref:hypothetical protein n=1 Tax=Stenotrophomonas sp. 24(2023) TaxID=3068324 RepID=UPI0027E1F9F5|nr:hypothetical protein [Stenotrophomonas sp. 24(2023)]WMJ70406.1 hypothetical protein Q9R17_04700 [Stenotrophomonas sp. 24(2023)]